MLAEATPLASPGSLDGGEWAFEMKWDGIRALAVVEDERVRYLSRSGHELTSSYPELEALVPLVNAEQVVLDGEIVTLGDHGAPSFSRLQRRFGQSDPRVVAQLRRSVPAAYFVFDVLSVNGTDCTVLPYRRRRELLGPLLDLPPGAPVAVPDLFDGPGDEALQESRNLHLEGVVAKRWEARYRVGARTSDWLKFPLIHTEEAVVIGWRHSEADPRGFASLLLADRRDGPLRYVGRVGTGFSSRDRREIRQRLESLACEEAAVEVPAPVRRDARWVKPRLSCEVTSKGRTSEGLLRQTVWRGWRPDKP
ncbi:non-homologous end-joining DNA ligase [Arthrobacter sp. NPDC090010]|uniref:non-homologous end-joining DNA ligase n=1 Tax=Arthrobacter sp. NPDC090010 TaxID=3363942 RepID=UPI0037F9E9B7